MFISASKNPMRALHMLLNAPQGEKGLILINLQAADETGNAEKASSLKLETTFRYSAAGEYLIFGGVEPRVGGSSRFIDLANDYKAIISYISLQSLMFSMPTTPNDEDPFKFKILQAHKTLSYARSAIKKDVHPMTYSLGIAVGQLVGILCVPPKNFETGMCYNTYLRQALLTLYCE